MNKYCNKIISVIKRVYIVENEQELFRMLKNFMIKYGKKQMSEKTILDQFIKYLKSLVPLPFKNDYNYKIDYITSMIKSQPNVVLDIGAGEGEILKGIKDHFGLPKESVYALDLQPIENNDVTVIHYTSDMKIPLADKSVDLVIMFSLLHHVKPNDRLELLHEVTRVLSPNGTLLIREHDAPNDKIFYIFLQLLHYVWYVHNHESYDPLVLMSEESLKKILVKFNFQPSETSKANDIQRMYLTSFHFKVITSL